MNKVKDIYQYKHRIRKLQEHVIRLKAQRDKEVDTVTRLQASLDVMAYGAIEGMLS